MKKAKWFKDGPEGVQLHAGMFRGKPWWHSDDGGKTWWCGTMFSHSTAVTLEELVEMAVGIIRDTPNKVLKGKTARLGEALETDR